MVRFELPLSDNKVTGMSDREALDLLMQWFGSKEFLVSDMTHDRVEELALLLGIEVSGSGVRGKVGRRLSKGHGLRYVTPTGKRFSLVVVKRAAGSIPAVYQVQQIS